MLSQWESICVSLAANVSAGHLLQYDPNAMGRLRVCCRSAWSQMTPSDPGITFHQWPLLPVGLAQHCTSRKFDIISVQVYYVAGEIQLCFVL